jgi:hypothetical protein
MLLWSSGLLASIERPMADALVRMATRSAPLLPGDCIRRRLFHAA